ncbi:MAG: flagellar basal body rod protein FlgC [Pseudomonas sp.]|uniref:flagellar basal body rod protein FlgC n=1 Tax=Stenotrophomonas sp. TaxID=69392 RepID=UPI003D6D9636
MADSIFAISRSALEVERQRMEVIAQNLANSGTVSTPGEEPHRAMRLISGPRTTRFDQALQQVRTDAGSSGPELSGVQSYALVQADAPARVVHDPSHPLADKNGDIAYPSIDHAGEMALMVQTLRTYEANTVMFNAARSMYMRALELGGTP